MIHYPIVRISQYNVNVKQLFYNYKTVIMDLMQVFQYKCPHKPPGIMSKYKVT